jgi:transcription elongation factor GreA
MADDAAIVKSVQEMLNEEKWTRAALSNYSINNFKELDSVVKQAKQEHLLDEVKEVCDEHLSHTKNSIIALYFSGMIALSKQMVDDSNLMVLMNIFSDNKKWNIVEYLCGRILEYGENKYALRTLADCYHSENNDQAIFPIWERLIKVDYDEADIVKLLAEKKEKEGAIPEAIDFYKKALHRYIAKKLFVNVKEIWNKLVQYCPTEFDFFMHVQNKIAKNISNDKAALLLQDLYPAFKQAGNWDVSIEILKTILEYDEKNSWARKEIVECYRGKYQNHSHLDDYIKLSNLNQSYRNAHEAILDFEKHIAFDAGNFVCHRTWGIGKIASVKGDEIVIDFARDRGHKMSLKMAISSLKTLSRDHIWTLKSIWSKEKLHDKTKSDIPWALKTVIKSFDNKADLKHIKAELVPSVLTVSEWTSWNTQAREILRTDLMFGNDPNDIDAYIVRDRPISMEEKIFNQFKAEKNFHGKVEAIRAFMKDGEPDSEYFAEMFNYFYSYLKSYTAVNEYVLASYIIVKEIITKSPYLNPGMNLSFADLLSEVEDLPGVFQSIKDTQIKHELLIHIKNFAANWADSYIQLFPYLLNRTMLDTLSEEGYEDRVRAMIQTIVENYREYRDGFLWVFKNVIEEPWFKDLGYSYEKLLIDLIHLLDVTFREIENHRETTLNRKLNKQVQTILFKEETLTNYLENADEDTLTRIYTLVEDVKDLDPAIKMGMRKKIVDRFPNFKFFGTEEKAVVTHGLMVTAAQYEAKQHQLQRIMEVEIPTNSKELGFALSLGDLRENAEYKAAKEKQELLNTTVGKLKDELERAQIFNPAYINSSRISFGTVVALHNNKSGSDETYTIMGPWESEPSKNVISYLSPFGNMLLNHKAGDTVDFIINEQDYSYLVKSIEEAKF